MISEKFKNLLKEDKIRYTYREDGIFSNIFKSPSGEFSDFKKAKKYLVQDLKTRMQDFKRDLDDVRSLRKNTLDGEGSAFSIEYDGMYSTIVKSDYGEFKTFAPAKKELIKYLNDRYKEYQNAWKDAVALKETDVEDFT